jgi:hypothetical protein
MMPNKLSQYEKRLAYEIKNIPEEYLPHLLQIIRIYRDSVSLKPADVSFRQGWKESLTDEIHPVSDLWDGIDAD